MSGKDDELYSHTDILVSFFPKIVVSLKINRNDSLEYF